MNECKPLITGAGQGWVLQLQTRVETVRLQRLKLTYDKRLSSFAFNSKLRQYTKAVMASVAEGQTNGHQEPIMFPFCRRAMEPPCKYLVIPDNLLGVFQLGKGGRLARPVTNRVFTSVGLTMGRGLHSSTSQLNFSHF